MRNLLIFLNLLTFLLGGMFLLLPAYWAFVLGACLLAISIGFGALLNLNHRSLSESFLVFIISSAIGTLFAVSLAMDLTSNAVLYVGWSYMAYMGLVLNPAFIPISLLLVSGFVTLIQTIFNVDNTIVTRGLGVVGALTYIAGTTLVVIGLIAGAIPSLMIGIPLVIGGAAVGNGVEFIYRTIEYFGNLSKGQPIANPNRGQLDALPSPLGGAANLAPVHGYAGVRPDSPEPGAGAQPGSNSGFKPFLGQPHRLGV